MSQDNEHIDLEYRPRASFFPLSAENLLTSKIKGEARRRIAEAAIQSGNLNEISSELLQFELSDDDRRHASQIHPSLMGGEYLPSERQDEVVVARIAIDSVTGDVTCVYARGTKKGILYRVVDEYEGETLSGKTKRLSKQPLTLQELTDFFLRAWPLDDVLEMNDLDHDSSQSFVHPSSNFYPQFEELIRRKIQEWRGAREEDGRDAEERAESTSIECSDRPSIYTDIPADEYDDLPNGFEDITEQTSLIARIALVNNYEQSEDVEHEVALRAAGLREFSCPKCHRLHWEIDSERLKSR